MSAPDMASPQEPQKAPPPLPGWLGWGLALTATFTMAVSYVDRQTLAALAPTVMRELGFDDAAYGLLLSGFSIAYLIGSPLAGRLIDAVGARKGMLGAVLVWSIVAALHAVAPGFAALFALRIALGLAEAPSFPGAAQTVVRALPPAERARGLGILFTGSSFGAMVAPKLATFFEARWGFRAAFLGSALVGLVWVPVWLLFAWNRRARAVLDHREPGAKAKAGVREMLRNVAVWRCVVVVLASAPLLGFHMLWLSKFLDSKFHVTQAEIGNLLILPPLLFDGGAVLFGSLATRAAKRRPDDDAPPRALLAIATAVAMLGALLPLCPGPWTAMVLAGVSMAGGGGMYALGTADVLRRVAPSAVSTAGGISAAAQSLALIIAMPLVGKAFVATGSHATAISVLVAIHLPGAAIWLLWKPPPLHRAEHEEARVR